MRRKFIVFSTLFSILTFNAFSSADYKLEIRAIKATIGDRDYKGDCCDIGFFKCGRCDVNFHFCVRAKGTSATSTSCWYSKETSDDKANAKTINFPSTGELYSGAGLENPISWNRGGSWPGSFQLMVRVEDSDGGNADDLVDRLTFDVDRSPSSSWTGTINGNSYYGRSSFSAQFRVRCQADFYTSSCSVYCKGRDDSGGHYDCNSSGQKVCKNGWSDPGTNCLSPICATGCSETGGYCDSPSQCLCKDGWTGNLCNQCIPKSGCSSAHGHCEGPYTCICETGYGGELCTQDADVCGHQMPCLHGATCTNTGLDSYKCGCVPGYTGANCQTEIDECDPDPCQNGANCIDGLNGYTCECVPGYIGSVCQTDINECDPDPCQNGASCQDLINDYSCSCLAGYVGSNCEGHKCDSAPCDNNGTCVNITSGDGYRCDCIHGYTGANCSSDINECFDNPCSNGGSCVNTIGSYQCICVPGYTGDNCTINIDECQQTNECSPNSLCVDGIDSYTCDCNPGYTGALCVDLIDYCEDGPCQNGGTCNNYIGSYGCNCPDGFNGSKCETNINDCDPNPCVNGGSCTDEINGFICTCHTNYTGTTCNTAVDYCDPNPCSTDEDCVTSSNGYLCLICLEDVCEDPSAIRGGNGSVQSPVPTSEPVGTGIDIGMMVGTIVGGITLFSCCLFCLICLCCAIYKKRKAKDEINEMHSWRGSERMSENPLFMPPELLVSSGSFSEKKGSSLKHMKTYWSPSGKDNPHDGFVHSQSVPNPLYSSESISPRPVSPSKNGYISLDTNESRDHCDRTKSPLFLKSDKYDKLEEKEPLDTPCMNYSATENPYINDPSVRSPLPHLPPRNDQVTDKMVKADLGNSPSDDDSFNPYEEIPDQAIPNHYDVPRSLPKETQSSSDENAKTNYFNPSDNIQFYDDNDKDLYEEIKY